MMRKPKLVQYQMLFSIWQPLPRYGFWRNEKHQRGELDNQVLILRVMDYVDQSYLLFGVGELDNRVGKGFEDQLGGQLVPEML